MTTALHWLAQHLSPNKRADRKAFKGKDQSNKNARLFGARMQRMEDTGRHTHFIDMEDLANMATVNTTGSIAESKRFKPGGDIHKTFSPFMMFCNNSEGRKNTKGFIILEMSTRKDGYTILWKEVYIASNVGPEIWDPVISAKRGKNGSFVVGFPSAQRFGALEDF